MVGPSSARGRLSGTAWRDQGRTFPDVDARLLGTAPDWVHDRYFTIGSDGRKYRSWHPPSVQLDPSDPTSPVVHFGHEHGDPPHVGAPPPAFGQAAFHAGLLQQVFDHAGFKVFTHRSGWLTGHATPEREPVAPDWDMQLTVHQGTSSVARLVQRFHEVAFWCRDTNGRTSEVCVMADAGVLEERGGSSRSGPGWPRRVVASHVEPDWERWTLLANVCGVWLGCFTVAVANPMTHVHPDPERPNELVVVPTSTEFAPPGTPALSLGHPHSAWLGQERVLYDADWMWNNRNRPEQLFTTPYGEPVANPDPKDRGLLRQRIAAYDFRSGPSAPWDRTAAALGAARLALPVGAPGGN
jgi:hypothetical protein